MPEEYKKGALSAAEVSTLINRDETKSAMAEVDTFEKKTLDKKAAKEKFREELEKKTQEDVKKLRRSFDIALNLFQPNSTRTNNTTTLDNPAAKDKSLPEKAIATDKSQDSPNNSSSANVPEKGNSNHHENNTENFVVDPDEDGNPIINASGKIGFGDENALFYGLLYAFRQQEQINTSNSKDIIQNINELIGGQRENIDNFMRKDPIFSNLQEANIFLEANPILNQIIGKIIESETIINLRTLKTIITDKMRQQAAPPNPSTEGAKNTPGETSVISMPAETVLTEESIIAYVNSDDLPNNTIDSSQANSAPAMIRSASVTSNEFPTTPTDNQQNPGLIAVNPPRLKHVATVAADAFRAITGFFTPTLFSPGDNSTVTRTPNPIYARITGKLSDVSEFPIRPLENKKKTAALAQVDDGIRIESLNGQSIVTYDPPSKPDSSTVVHANKELSKELGKFDSPLMTITFNINTEEDLNKFKRFIEISLESAPKPLAWDFRGVTVSSSLEQRCNNIQKRAQEASLLPQKAPIAEPNTLEATVKSSLSRTNSLSSTSLRDALKGPINEAKSNKIG